MDVVLTSPANVSDALAFMTVYTVLFRMSSSKIPAFAIVFPCLVAFDRPAARHLSHSCQRLPVDTECAFTWFLYHAARWPIRLALACGRDYSTICRRRHRGIPDGSYQVKMHVMADLSSLNILLSPRGSLSWTQPVRLCRLCDGPSEALPTHNAHQYWYDFMVRFRHRV